jgi:hypothetical protein
VDDDRRRLNDLSARLLLLHGVLLERERTAYESLHGPIAPRELLRLLLGDEQFAWLRSLSQLIARIDEAVDSDTPEIASTAEDFVRETSDLVRSGASEAFAVKYAAALQDSPDVVMAHADVVKLLTARQEGKG